MRLIKYIIIVILFSHCTAEMPHDLIGTWQVEKYDHSVEKINKQLNQELNKRAKSTIYEFNPDFSVEVSSLYSESAKKGTWYWDPYRKKLVINEEAVFDANIDTIFIENLTKNSMVWVQSVTASDKNFIHLKRLK